MAVKKYRVVISHHARNSLRDIVQYISKRNSKETAEYIRANLILRTRELETHPNAFPKEQLLNPKKGEFHFIVQWSYKIIYEIKDDQVRILDFFHTSQHPGKIDY